MFDEADDEKRTKARRLARESIASGQGLISHQVVQETLKVLGHKLGATTGQQIEFFEDVLGSLGRVFPSHEMFRSAIAICGRFGYGLYDSLIIAAALEARCSRLYSEDLKSGPMIDRLTIVNPVAD